MVEQAYGTRKLSIQTRMVEPEAGKRPPPIWISMILLVKAAKSWRISLTGAGYSSSSESTKSNLNAGTFMFSWSK